MKINTTIVSNVNHIISVNLSISRDLHCYSKSNEAAVRRKHVAHFIVNKHDVD